MQQHLPVTHPAAQCALAVAQTHCISHSVLHVYTDGSCKGSGSAWAFVVVAQTFTAYGPTFWKVGYAADILDETIGPFQPTAMDAEATALIAAVEFLLPLVSLEQDVHFHFDALSVGFGAFGKHATPTYHWQYIFTPAQCQSYAVILAAPITDTSGACTCT